MLVALIVFGPFLFMMTIPHSTFMAALMSFEMTRGAVLLEGPFVVLAGWPAWHWLELAPLPPARIVAALGVVLVASPSVWDLYWHQSHPLEMGASMNMLSLPPHHVILAGFVLGLVGTAAMLTISPRRAESRS